MTAGRMAVSGKKDWGTPPHYVDAVKEVFEAPISLDPCSSKHSVVGAEVELMPPDNDGLTHEWDYPRIYVNPPYGLDVKNHTSISDWLRKCADAHAMYGASVIALVPVATNTGHWKKYVFGKARSVCFLADTRLKFLTGGKDGGKGAPMSCATVYYGKDPTRFRAVFKKYGAVVNVIAA